MSRHAEIKRTTAETDVFVFLQLDGSGNAGVDTGNGFFNHMLELFARHSRFDLTVKCRGDLAVDCHHTVEDVAICLGGALHQALGECRGINRYGSIMLPMDEALVLCAADISGRAQLECRLDIPAPRVGEFDTELAEEFFAAFVRSAGITLHLRQLEGRNSHHIIEACFKALGRTLRQAAALDPALADEIPSTKGVL